MAGKGSKSKQVKAAAKRTRRSARGPGFAPVKPVPPGARSAVRVQLEARHAQNALVQAGRDKMLDAIWKRAINAGTVPVVQPPPRSAASQDS